jgi:hypothetical protein
MEHFNFARNSDDLVITVELKSVCVCVCVCTLKIAEKVVRSPLCFSLGLVSIYINELFWETHYEWTVVITHNSLERS